MKAGEVNQKMRSIMNAKTGLKAIGMFAVFLTVTSIIDLVMVVLKLDKILYYSLKIMTYLVIIPLRIGYMKYNLDLLRGKQVTLRTLFEGFTKRYFLKTVLALLLLLLLLAIGCFFAYLIITLVFRSWVSIFLFPLFIYIIIIFSQFMYRIIDNPSASSWEAITSSCSMMKGNVWNYIVQTLSLFPLFLLPAIVAVMELRDPLAKTLEFATYASAPITSITIESILLYLVGIIVSLLIDPRINMAYAIWYDDKAREAYLEIEEYGTDSSISVK